MTLPLAAALPRPAPQQFQHDGGLANACGPYSASMALNYCLPGHSTGTSAAAEIPWRLPGRLKVSGATPPFGIVTYLRRHGLHVTARAGGRLRDLQTAIVAGWPVLVLVRPATATQFARHYRVVVGYDDVARLLHFNDPAYPVVARPEPGNFSVPYGTFRDEWESGGFGALWRRWYAVVRGTSTEC